MEIITDVYGRAAAEAAAAVAETTPLRRRLGELFNRRPSPASKLAR
jgi:hypothetical protein